MATAQKKVSQGNLRQLMSLQKRKAVESSKRIESPLAKYSNGDVLTCIVCESVVRSEAVWSVHINSKQHRDNIAKKKTGVLPTTAAPTTATAVFKAPKRPPPSVDSQHSAPKKPKGILKNAPPVPEGFFDDVIVASTTGTKPDESDPAEDNEPMDVDGGDEALPPSELPEGFFDNPVLDAKARNVEYKDPIQEEWERFQKEIKEETTVSAQIIYDDTEDATAQRQIEEIDEQLRKLSKVVELDHKREKVKAKVLSKPKEIKEEDMSSDGEDFDIDFDWRAKRYLC